MKKSILITGASGSGKSEVSRALKELGYETYDMDTFEDLCVMVDKKTGLPTPYDNSNDREKIEKMYWLYKKDVLSRYVAEQKHDVAFYCGFPNNLEDILPAFTDIILLVASPDIIRQRLNARTDNGFGKSPEVQDYILQRKEKMEKSLQEKGAVVINADDTLDIVVRNVVAAIADADALANAAMDRGS